MLANIQIKMNKTIKHEDTWYLFQDGTIGVLTLDGNEYAIASGDPGRFHAMDYDLTPLHKAIKVGPTSKLPTLEAAIGKIRRMNAITGIASRSRVQTDRLINEARRVHEITGRFLKNQVL